MLYTQSVNADKEKYPVITEGHGVFIQPDYGYIFTYNGVKRLSAEPINVQASAILEQCTGGNTVKDIGFTLEETFEETPPDLLSQVGVFLDELAGKGYIEYRDTPVSLKGLIQGSTTYYTPTRVLIEVTKACNLSCGHCLLSAGSPVENELSSEQYLSLLNRFFAMGVNRITLSGGEVLTKKGWNTLVDFCIDRFYTVFLTNALLVTEKTADNLKDCDEIHVSLYGCNPEVYEKITRVKGSFKKALRGITLLSNRNNHVGVSIPVTPDTVEDLQDIIDLAVSLHCTKARVGTVIPLGRAHNGHYELTALQKKQVDTMVKEFQQMYTIDIGWEDDPGKGEKCGAGFTRWVVASNGDVYPCVLFRVSIGNLVRDDPVAICRSRAVHFLKELKAPCETLCGDCPLLYMCAECHGQAFAHYTQVAHCPWVHQFETAPELLKRQILK